MSGLRDRLGICQWFHYEDCAAVEQAVELLHELGVRHLRTGISWADYHRPHGRQWYDWQMAALSDFEVLLSIWHTPPSISEASCCASPPRRLLDYADFVALMIEQYRDYFSHIELWNEPNNRYKWAFDQYDPGWLKFAQMIRSAGLWARQCQVPTVLGGMMPVDHHWLRLMDEQGALESVDYVGIHSFPMMWWDDAPNWDWYGHWDGWEQKIDYISQSARGREIWVTETGLATWDLNANRESRLELQVQMLRAAAEAPVPRIYWYSLIDLDPARDAIEGFHIDENEYHMGLVRCDGSKKPAWEAMYQLLHAGQPDQAAVRRG
jgi:CDP-paratose 2-epimerase